MSRTLPNRVREAAEAELRSPTFATSEQLLEAHRLVVQDGRPRLAGWWEAPEDRYSLYFRIEGEAYYLLVAISDAEEGAVFDGMDVEADISIAFLVCGNDLDPASVTELLGIVPTYTRAIGELGRAARTPGKFHLWELEDRGPGPFEERLGALLALLSEHGSGLAALVGKAEPSISVGYRGYRELMHGVHLSQEAIATLANLGLSIDFDLYASGPDLPE
jgi:hypothetical protein